MPCTDTGSWACESQVDAKALSERASVQRIATMTARGQRVYTMLCGLFTFTVFTGLLSGLRPLSRLRTWRFLEVWPQNG